MPAQNEDELIDGLNEMERKFSELFTKIGSKTCANARLSAIGAGYSGKSAHTTGWRLKRRESVQKYIAELRGMNADKILSDLEETRLAAMKKGDFAVSARCSELQGKTLALFVDRVSATTEDLDQQEMTDDEKSEADEWAEFRLWKAGRKRDVPQPSDGYENVRSIGNVK